MMHRTRIIALWMAFGVLLWSPLTSAQPNQGDLLLSSLEINQKLMTYAEGKDFDKIEDLLPTIKPLTDAQKAKFGIDVESELRSALSTQDHDRVLRVMQQLVYLDLKDMMNTSIAIMGESIDQAKAILKTAYLNYLLLSPYIQRHHFSSDQRIRKNYRIAILTLIAFTPYHKEKVRTVDRLDRIKQLIREIDNELAEALSGFTLTWQDGSFKAV